MRRIGFFLLLSGLGFCSCNPPAVEPPEASIYGKWMLVSREDYAANQVFYKDPAAVQNYCRASTPCEVIILLEKVSGTNALTGHTITNELGGKFSVNERTHKISFGPIHITEVFDPPWSENIHNLVSVTEYRIEGQVLHLYFDNNKQSLVFERQ